MSNFACKNCKSIAVEYEDYVGGTAYYRCKTCGQRGDKDKFTQVTVFHQITASPEVLAPLLVWNDYDWCVFRSAVIDGGGFDYKEEAIAATVERLKEVCDEVSKDS